MNKETFKQAGYKYVRFAPELGGHILNDGTKNELWFANKNHASWGLKYKNTHLEFARTI